MRFWLALTSRFCVWHPRTVSPCGPGVGALMYVYFIQAGDNGPIKIGHAGDPLKRAVALARLWHGCPLPSELGRPVKVGMGVS